MTKSVYKAIGLTHTSAVQQYYTAVQCSLHTHVYSTPASSRSLLFFLSSSFASDHRVTYLLPTQRGNSNTFIFLRVITCNTTSGSFGLYVPRLFKNRSCEKSRHEATAVCHVTESRPQLTLSSYLMDTTKMWPRLCSFKPKNTSKEPKLTPRDYNSSPNKFA